MFRCLISRKVEKRQRLLIVKTYESTDITISKSREFKSENVLNAIE